MVIQASSNFYKRIIIRCMHNQVSTVFLEPHGKAELIKLVYGIWLKSSKSS